MAMAPEPVPRSATSRSGRVHQRSTRSTNSSVSGRGTSTAGRHLEVQRPELAPAQKIGHGHAVARGARSSLEARGHLGGHRFAGARQQLRAASAPARGEQDFRVAAVDVRAALRQEPCRCRTWIRSWGSDDARVPPGIGIMPA